MPRPSPSCSCRGAAEEAGLPEGEVGCRGRAPHIAGGVQQRKLGYLRQKFEAAVEPLM